MQSFDILFSMMIATADLYDQYGDSVTVAAPIFRDFGKVTAFSGAIVTIQCFEDNSFVKTALNEPGENRVLVVNGGASLRCALLGDMLGESAVKNNWAGIIVNGCIRDSRAISELNIGVKALATSPVRSVKKNIGKRDITLHFAGVSFIPNEFIYADEDGIIISPKELTVK